MAKKMLINVDADENRVAILEDGRLENLEIETNLNEQVKGNIFKGVVHKVEQSLQAAFVDYGVEKQGFLPLGEIHPRYWPKDAGSKPTIQDILQNRQELLVQVTRDEIGNKGATLTTYVSLPGRYLVLIPESEKTGISRKLSDEERARLKELVTDMSLPEGFGAIIRTAGTDRSLPELQLDLSYLTKVWEAIERRFKEQKGSGLVYEERSLAVRFMRDYFADDMEEVWIDDPEGHKELLEFVNLIMPQHASRVKLYQGRVPLFIKQGVEDQIEDVFARKVELPSGGSIVLDSTEALVAIDVNSGRVKGEDIEETAFTTNMEAAREIARQVVIRDLGGLVVIDFIDMKDRKRMRQVEQALREAFRNDKARRKFSRISEFGLLEMTRQRMKSTLTRTSFERCDHCGGQGLVRSAESAGMYLLRRIREISARGSVHQVIVRAPIPVANFMLNRKRPELQALEMDQKTLVEVWGDTDLPPNQAVLESVHKRGKGAPQRVTQTVDLVKAEIVRRDEESLKRGILTREPGRNIDFQSLYKEVIDEHGPAEVPAPAPVAASAPPPVAPPPAYTPQRHAAPPPEPPKERRFSWWRKLFGAAEEPPTPHVPAPQTPSAHAPQHGAPSAHAPQHGAPSAHGQAGPAQPRLTTPLHGAGAPGRPHAGRTRDAAETTGQTRASAPRATAPRGAAPGQRPSEKTEKPEDEAKGPTKRRRRRRRSRSEGTQPESTTAPLLDDLDDEIGDDDEGPEDTGEQEQGGVDGPRKSRRRRGRGRGKAQGERAAGAGEGAGPEDGGPPEPRRGAEGAERPPRAPAHEGTAPAHTAVSAPNAPAPASQAPRPVPPPLPPLPQHPAPSTSRSAEPTTADSRWIVDLRTPSPKPTDRGEE